MAERTHPAAPVDTSAGDHAHTAAKAALSLVPIVGGPAVELFNSLVTPPLERRRTEWMQSVAERLTQLEQEGRVAVEELKNNESFITTVVAASQAAVRTHHEEKREALRNALTNSALPGAPEDFLQQTFIRWVDELSVWHMSILALFSDPPNWFLSHNRPSPDTDRFSFSLAELLETAYPEMKGRRTDYDHITKELYDRGLLATASLHVNMSGSGVMLPQATDMGLRFIRFLSPPAE